MNDQNDFNRRDFLRLSGIAGAGVVMVACGAPADGGEAAAPAAEEAAASEAAAPAEAGAVADRGRALRAC